MKRAQNAAPPRLTIRPAKPGDAGQMAAVLHSLVLAGKRRKNSDLDFALTHYISHPDRVECLLAQAENGDVLGFQALKFAREGNVYGAPVGWGIIGTHIRPDAARQGAGKALFAQTQKAAKHAGLPAIEALIGAKNSEGLGYYTAMGFYDYRQDEGAVGKRFDLT